MANMKELDRLIEQVMSEVAQLPPDGYKISTDLPFQKTRTAQTQNALDALKNIESPKDVLDSSDVKELVDNPEKITFDHIKASRTLVTKFKAGFKDGKYTTREMETEATNAIEALSAIETSYDQYVQSKQKPESTVSSPEFASRRGEAISGTAPFPAEQLAIIKRAMEGKGTGSFKGRLKHLSDISKMFYGASTGDKRSAEAIKRRPISETLNNIMLMDIFNYIVKDMDAGAGAYLFEYFLALLFEGRVTGKETTEAGKMGATDFVTKEGKRGSVKYYSAPSSIEQAIGGFPLNQNVNYIVGIKREDISQAGVAGEAGKADPARIVAVDIYAFPVKQVRRGVFQSGSTPVENKGSKLKLGPLVKDSNYVGTVYLTASPTSNFQETLDSAMGNVQGNIEKAFSKMKEMINAMSVAKAASKQYISSGEINIGNEAWQQMGVAEEKYRDLVGFLSPDEGYGKMHDTEKKIVATESKQSQLDKLNELITELFFKNT